ncbi:hypothetical protein GX917_02100 [Candidatus Falkowbacteria bacterium]|jgi:hypothetical protein|nr:hypothetical protein [Candidatus Falkowbacteria bacterium]
MLKLYLTTNQKNKAIFLVASFLFFFFLMTAAPAQAATSTVRGVAWAGDSYREVYMNCLDAVVGSRLDQEGNLYNFPEPRGFHFFADPCQAGMQHAVYIDENGNFSGQAWNPTVNFISFSGTATPPDNYSSTNAHCPHTCNASNNCWACLNETDQKVYGWARIDVSGEWIKLDNDLEPTSVSLQGCDLSASTFPGHGIPVGDFVGYAVADAGNTNFTGTISFNCESEAGGSACEERNYKVYIGNLTLGALTAPNWSYTQACNNALGAALKWCKRSGIQTAYEVMVSTSNTPDPSSAVCWSRKKISDYAFQYTLPNADLDCAPLNYGTNYYWWVRAYDENDEPTEWYQYNSNSATDTDGNPDGNPLTFTTFKHNFPNPFITWEPLTPVVGTTTLFSAINSQYYTTAQPSLPQSCAGNNCNYLWSVSGGTYTISTTTAATTSIVFTNSIKGAFVELELRDSDNYMCKARTAPMEINYDLPLWREVKAK